MKLIRISRRSIRKNPDYNDPGTRTYLPGPKEITIIYHGKPSKKQLEHCVVLSQALPLNGPSEYELAFQGDDQLAYKLFGKDKKVHSIVINMHHIETTCKYYGETHLYKYQNPFIKCNECGISTRYSDIQHVEDDDYITVDICPRCKAIESFDYKLEKLTDVL